MIFEKFSKFGFIFDDHHFKLSYVRKLKSFKRYLNFVFKSYDQDSKLTQISDNEQIYISTNSSKCKFRLYDLCFIQLYITLPVLHYSYQVNFTHCIFFSYQLFQTLA